MKFLYAYTELTSIQAYLFIQEYKIVRFKVLETMNFSYQTKCKYCLQQHHPRDRCCIACPYCHQYHHKSQMTDFVCPHLRSHIQQHHQKDRLVCKGCDGEGILEKEVTTRLYEKQRKYLSRLEEYSQKLQKCEGRHEQLGPKPERKLLKELVKKEEVQCNDCSGSGTIKKIIICCLEGCSKCQYERCRINPIWAYYHCQKVSRISNKSQLCSHCENQIDANSKYSRLGCGHGYHNDCYIREVYLSDGKCVLCGHIQKANLSDFSEIQKPEGSLHNVGIDLSLSSNKEEYSFVGEAAGVQNSEVKIDIPNDEAQDSNLMRGLLQARIFNNYNLSRPIAQNNQVSQASSVNSSLIEEGTDSQYSDGMDSQQAMRQYRSQHL